MINYVMLHHTAVSHSKNKNQFDANNSYHKAKWGVKSSMGFYLGYNYEISYHGKVKQARKDGEQTVACYQGSMNDGRCIHIVLDGNFDTEKPSPSQIYALRDLLRKLVKKHDIKDIYGHRDFAVKTCPGKNIDIKWLKGLAGVNTFQPSKEETVAKIIELLKTL